MNNRRDESWKRMGKRAVCAVCLAALLGASRPAASDEATAARRLLALYVTVKMLGYQGGLRSQDADVISEGQFKRYDLVLNRGVRYAFFAAGDENISDLDIYIYALYNNLLTHNNN